jgi:hypothetical protein
MGKTGRGHVVDLIRVVAHWYPRPGVEPSHTHR